MTNLRSLGDPACIFSMFNSVWGFKAGWWELLALKLRALFGIFSFPFTRSLCSLNKSFICFISVVLFSCARLLFPTLKSSFIILFLCAHLCHVENRCLKRVWRAFLWNSSFFFFTDENFAVGHSVLAQRNTSCNNLSFYGTSMDQKKSTNTHSVHMEQIYGLDLKVCQEALSLVFSWFEKNTAICSFHRFCWHDEFKWIIG